MTISINNEESKIIQEQGEVGMKSVKITTIFLKTL